MNRDEYRTRHESNKIKCNNGCYYPVDNQSLGTWFGFNQNGMVMALLNRYQDQHLDKSINSPSTRGIIIPQLLQAKSYETVFSDLLAKHLFNPFDLMVINSTKVTQFSWNGINLIQTEHGFPYFISSSSVDSDAILAHRKQLFLDFKAVNQQQILSHLHLAKDESDTSSSINMSRDSTHTKSISQVLIENGKLTYHYLTENNLHNIDKQKPYTHSQNRCIKLGVCPRI
jgi:uncharacterized protein with NRDE domain